MPLLSELPLEILAGVLDQVQRDLDWRNATLSCRALFVCLSSEQKRRRYEQRHYLGLRRFDPKRLRPGTTQVVGPAGSGKTNLLRTLIEAIGSEHWGLISAAGSYENWPLGRRRNCRLDWERLHDSQCADKDNCRSIYAYEDMFCPPYVDQLREPESLFAFCLITRSWVRIDHPDDRWEGDDYPCLWMVAPTDWFVALLYRRHYVDDQTCRKIGDLRLRRDWLVLDGRATDPARRLLVWPDVPLYKGPLKVADTRSPMD